MFRDALLSGISQLSNFPKSTDIKIDLLLDYLQLLIKWNKAYNLTAIRNPEEMISKHILDSLSIAPYLNGKYFLDVGTGAGLPGVILAILYPHRQFDLLDSNGKKTRFLFQVKTELKLDNISIFQCRVENHSVGAVYDGILSRAFSTLHDMVKGSGHLLKDSGNFYAMKGIYPSNEIEDLASHDLAVQVAETFPLNVPGENAERHLVVISKN
ncbi:MAG: 16S rRNA (guanine527-N7)-methyltransferase [Gammaproteobacteria bacterium]|jgi:16S rRNA (guanine527-N7)-methyltransferase